MEILSKNKKLIVIKPNGNSSNRLVQNLHFEVFCLEHNIQFQNPTFADMAKFYTSPCNSQTNRFLRFLQIDLLGKIFRHSKLVKRIFSIVWIISRFGFLKLVRFDRVTADCEQTLLKAFEKNDVVYSAGWAFRVPELVEKYGTEMRMKYALKPYFYNKNEFADKINHYKSNGYTLTGVHIRRGDYKTWKNGMYYFDDDVYKKQMDNLSRKLQTEGKEKQIFILFSNEPLQFEQSSNLLISSEKWFIDHHIMAQCDYLIGPPSTFTLWASFVGQSELIRIYNDTTV